MIALPGVRHRLLQCSISKSRHPSPASAGFALPRTASFGHMQANGPAPCEHGAADGGYIEEAQSPRRGHAAAGCGFTFDLALGATYGDRFHRYAFSLKKMRE
jgi:hypothetical protein